MISKTKSKTGPRGVRGDKKKLKKRDAYLTVRKKFCRFCADKVKAIDYKDMRRLEAFITERAKIVSSRYSGNCAKHQRQVREAINKARFMALLPYVR